jgi:hypothetical protein
MFSNKTKGILSLIGGFCIQLVKYPLKTLYNLFQKKKEKLKKIKK